MINDKERINILEEKLNNLVKEVNELKQNSENNTEPDRKRANYGEEYYYIDEYYEICVDTEEGISIDDVRFVHQNYFVNREDAEQYLRVLNTEMKLKELAKELNIDYGEKIDWEDGDQIKYRIIYDYTLDDIDYTSVYQNRDPHAIYCLDENFKNKAISEIGEKALKEYLIYEF